METDRDAVIEELLEGLRARFKHRFSDLEREAFREAWAGAPAAELREVVKGVLLRGGPWAAVDAVAIKREALARRGQTGTEADVDCPHCDGAGFITVLAPMVYGERVRGRYDLNRIGDLDADDVDSVAVPCGCHNTPGNAGRLAAHIEDQARAFGREVLSGEVDLIEAKDQARQAWKRRVAAGEKETAAAPF